jgi:hypothetical protein
MNVFANPQSREYARLTGGLYLSIAVFGAFAIGYVPSVIVVPSDPAGTLANIVDRRGLYLAGIGADAAVMLIEIMALTMLYFMFRPVSATVSFAAAMARLSMVGVMAAMLFFHAGLSVLADPGALAGFGPEQRAGVAGLLLDMHHAGIWIWQLFFSLHLILLGWLVRSSGQYPRLLGLAIMIGATGYAADSIYAFAFPDVTALSYLRIGFLVIVTLAEVGFALWLLIRGPRAAA